MYLSKSSRSSFEPIDLQIGEYGSIRFRPPNAGILRNAVRSEEGNDAMITQVVLNGWLNEHGGKEFGSEGEWNTFLEGMDFLFYNELIKALTPFLNPDPTSTQETDA